MDKANCSFREVDKSGRILCRLMQGADRGVQVDLCSSCPILEISCHHLHATLYRAGSSPMTVRYATGRVEVWQGESPEIRFRQAGCAAKRIAITSPSDCAGCPLRAPLVAGLAERAVPARNRARRARNDLDAATRAQARRQAPGTGPTGHSSPLADSKIIRLREWLAGTRRDNRLDTRAVVNGESRGAASQTLESSYVQADAVDEPDTSYERCAGWTD